MLASARADLDGLAPRSTVILDGVCPFHGPAIVFDSYWDFGGALTIALGRPVNGDVISSRTRALPDGIETSIYGERSFHQYGPHLYVYDPRKHLVLRLGDAKTAERHFRSSPNRECPGFEGRGVAV